jgi:hypothetical protein
MLQQQIGLRDDAEDVVFVVDHGNSADMPLGQHAHQLLVGC